MDLLDRYLGAIARHLPDRQKADVTAELRDVLLSEIEEEEERLGRPQTREELEALLVRFGHPLTVSGRYRKVQHLIGPEIFPFWWASLKVVGAGVIAVYLVVAVLLLAAGDHAPAMPPGSRPSPVVALVFAFGAVTLIAALIERFGKTAILTKWRPRDLPPPSPKSKSLFERLLETGMGIVFLLWWTGLLQFRYLVPESGFTMSMAPVWREMYWPILAYGAFELAMNLLALLRPGLVAVNRTFSLARNLFGATVLGFVLQAGHWVDVNWAVWTPQVQAQVQANFDTGMRVGIVFAVAIFLALAAVDAWRLWQLRQARRGGPRMVGATSSSPPQARA